jgi:hypothetical protein
VTVGSRRPAVAWVGANKEAARAAASTDIAIVVACLRIGPRVVGEPSLLHTSLGFLGAIGRLLE